MTKFEITSKEWTIAAKYPCFYLDSLITYKNGTRNFIICKDCSPFNDCQVGDYLEIDTDRLKYRRSGEIFGDTSIVRKVGSSLTSTRNAMINASSANPTALAVTRDLADRVDRGEQTNFKYEIEDNGVKHSWIYKKN